MIPLRGVPARRQWPLITIGLVAFNLVIFLYQLYLGPEASLELIWKGGAIPSELSRVKLFTSRQSLLLVATMFSSLFIHGGWVHLLGNLLILWVFGEALEDDLGHWRFLGFYLFCGFFAGLVHALVASRLTIPIIGASGAIAGLLGAYLVRFPQAPVQTLIYLGVKFRVVEIPAFVWLGAWVLLQFYGLRQGGAVAWFAHLGGFLTGLLAIPLFTHEPLPARLKKPRRKR
ncbi:MAG: rhomboid family intramembrane serine protease [Deltaproteobacteria bacterium]|nr:rhomboid family intramembrane serine protease [Deltaproteobacteria bacterium]MBW1953081.1 rhomboid family intramembrane serine protease [Deltaproteobacteria bacterium]MBW1987178.1 rhomboid family intramembrane serine protease [Deltaproteobacteria bacterium]MBW2135040.1 rhomboid family intramembrane serine protease [Deltaproteobacteria bacterium]